MAQDRLDNVVLLGAGVLGGQIAWQSAFKGKAVVVYDLREEGLEQCRADQQRYADIYMRDLGATESMMADTRARLSFTTDLAAAVAEADLVIEAVPEVPDIKIALYQELAGYLPEHTLSPLIHPHCCPASSPRPRVGRKNIVHCILPT
jgi:3-hydroxybutyryl-CoA dehydrogenase